MLSLGEFMLALCVAVLLVVGVTSIVSLILYCFKLDFKPLTEEEEKKRVDFYKEVDTIINREVPDRPIFWDSVYQAKELARQLQEENCQRFTATCTPKMGELAKLHDLAEEQYEKNLLIRAKDEKPPLKPYNFKTSGIPYKTATSDSAYGPPPDWKIVDSKIKDLEKEIRILKARAENMEKQHGFGGRE